MSEAPLTKEEKELLKQYQNLSTSVPSVAGRLAVEVVPAAIFIGAWVYTGHALYLVVFITALVGYNIQRIVRQYKHLLKLRSISKKTIGK
ncbi:MAG TPA: hypothetical protein VFA36_12380 [Burkholderiales bacterium]|nr:hypothetical protein [Burkholderiales bacterium]